MVTLKNKNGESMAFSHTFPILLKSFKQGGIGVDLIASRIAGLDGQMYQGSTISTRQFVMEYALEGQTEEELNLLKSQLINIIDASKGELTIEKELGENLYEIKVAVDNYPEYKDITATAAESKLIFVASDPYWREVNGEKFINIIDWLPNFEFPANITAMSSENLLNGTDFSKDTSFGLFNRSSGTFEQDKANSVIKLTLLGGTENGLATTRSNVGFKKGHEYTFSIKANSSIPTLNAKIVSKDSSSQSEDGFTYPNNCVTIKENFAVRDADGNMEIGNMIPIGTPLTVLWCNWDKQLLNVEYKDTVAKTIKTCWITNDPTCLSYYWPDSFTNENKTTQIYFKDLVTLNGTIDPNAKATVLYKYLDYYCVVANGDKGIKSRIGIVKYTAGVSASFLNESLGTISLGSTNMGLAKITFIPSHNHTEAILAFTSNLAGTLEATKPKLEYGSVVHTWNPSLEDYPTQDTGIELGYKDTKRMKNVINNGNTKVGVQVEFKVSGPITNPKLENVSTGQKIEYAGSFIKGDRIVFSNYGPVIKSYKYVDNIEKYTPITNESDWSFGLQVGDNKLKYSAGSNEENIEVSIKYTEKFVEV